MAFQCVFVDEDRSSITAVKLLNDKVLAARLNGTLSFYKLNSITLYAMNDSINGVTKHRKGEPPISTHRWIVLSHFTTNKYVQGITERAVSIRCNGSWEMVLKNFDVSNWNRRKRTRNP